MSEPIDFALSGIKFTSKIYFCPTCGKEIAGYIEDESEGEHAGCSICLNEWKVSILKRADREEVQFT